MWVTIRLMGVEVVALGVSIGGADDESATRYIDNSGGSFELATDDGEEAWDDEDGEYDPEYDNRRPPFGFLHA